MLLGGRVTKSERVRNRRRRLGPQNRHRSFNRQCKQPRHGSNSVFFEPEGQVPCQAAKRGDGPTTKASRQDSAPANAMIPGSPWRPTPAAKAPHPLGQNRRREFHAFCVKFLVLKDEPQPVRTGSGCGTGARARRPPGRPGVNRAPPRRAASYPDEHALFLQAPSFFSSSQLAVIWRRWERTEKPSLWEISLSIWSILLLSNSTIFSQSWQMMWW